MQLRRTLSKDLLPHFTQSLRLLSSEAISEANLLEHEAGNNIYQIKYINYSQIHELSIEQS